MTSPPPSTRQRLLSCTLLLLAGVGSLALVGGLGYFLIYRPAVVIPRQREQRKLYERWRHLDNNIASLDPEDVPRGMHRQRDDVVEECERRFGQHPTAYSSLPSISSGYY